MRLVTFVQSGEARLGVLVGDEVLDLQRADPDLPNDVLSLLQGGPPMLEQARWALAAEGCDSLS